MSKVLTAASRQLFSRRDDERYESLQALHEKCIADKAACKDSWQLPGAYGPVVLGGGSGGLGMKLGDAQLGLTDWSFTQLCKLAGVSKETVNRVTPDTASRVLLETLPAARKPTQFLTTDTTVRSVHGTNYTRLWNADLLSVVREFAVGFTPPQKGFNGATGLYAGEQDVFAFMIDPEGWAEIEGEAFAPGFFVWNSEVGRRSLGVQAFWFQAVCCNHIVWDATEVVDYTRRHTTRIDNALADVREIIGNLIERRDARKAGFVTLIRKAMTETLGSDADEALKVLLKHGIPQGLGKKALEMAEAGRGRFTLFAVVDALTQMAREFTNAGDRLEADIRAAGLLKLVSPADAPNGTTPLLAA